jgi:arylsulfatase A
MSASPSPRRRFRILLAIVLSMLFAGANVVTAAELPSRPNVMIVLCDDLGYGDLACFGHPAIRTPNLDKLAAEGVRLTSCYSASPVCSSSRAGLITGRTPSRSGIYDWIPRDSVVYLRSSEITIATLLKQAGYDTCHVGKWHLNGKFNDPEQPQPGDHGFDHWMSTQNNAIPSHENPKNFVRNGKPLGPQTGFACQLVADEALRWLDGRKDDNPFFLYVCFHEPHEPVASPPDLVATYLDDDGPKARNEDEAQYFANVTNIDAAVGRLMASLKERGMDKNTLVVFTSDNGPETLKRYPRGTRSYGSPGPLRGMKLWLYEGGIRVPGIARWKGVIEAGQTCDVPVCSLDLLPTLCELAKVEPPKDRTLDGTSLVPLLAGQSFERKKPLTWDYFNALGDPKAAMRLGDFTLLARRASPTNVEPGIVSATTMPIIKSETLGGFELYDVKNDIGQKHDLAASKSDFVSKHAPELVKKHREVRDEGPTWQFDDAKTN